MGCYKTNTKEENIIKSSKFYQNYNDSNFIFVKNHDARFTLTNKKINKEIKPKINSNTLNEKRDLNINLNSIEIKKDEFEKKPPTKERVKHRINEKNKKNLENLLVQGHYDSYEIEKNFIDNSVDII